MAPDNKIYVATWANSYAMHTIHYPDSPGVACQVEQHSILLPCQNAVTVPNLINYDLGPLMNSACDTIVAVGELNSRSYTLEIYPNPTKSGIQLKYYFGEDQEARVVFFNSIGIIVKEIDLPSGQGELQVGLQNLPASIYHYKVYVNGKASKFGKVILIH